MLYPPSEVLTFYGEHHGHSCRGKWLCYTCILHEYWHTAHFPLDTHFPSHTHWCLQSKIWGWIQNELSILQMGFLSNILIFCITILKYFSKIGFVTLSANTETCHNNIHPYLSGRLSCSNNEMQRKSPYMLVTVHFPKV